MEDRTSFMSPLSGRYASKEMRYIFSDEFKFRTWRDCWIALAEAERELGLKITEEQLADLKNYRDDINYESAEEKEREIRHDVMAHVYAYGEQAKVAKPIIHLGATSCLVTDNTELIQMKSGLNLVKKKLINVIYNLAKFAKEYRDMPTLAYTHYQPAQPTTVGRRAINWCNDLVMDLREIVYREDNLLARGAKGTTGTQASYLELFNGNHEKVRKLDQLFAEKLDFRSSYSVTTQTYSRKVDSQILKTLSGIAESAHKFSNDIRLLQHDKEIEEPFEKEQVGSSAMAYKRNPMRDERIGGMSNYSLTLPLNLSIVTATQWLERTLDDSSNRRISIPDSFLVTDGILNLYLNVTEDLVIYPKIIEKHLKEELPFMVTENILMESVKKGSDRQELHKIIRDYSMEAARRVKELGLDNNLLELLASDKRIPLTREEISGIANSMELIGRAPEQVDEFLEEIVDPLLVKYGDLLGEKSDIKV